MVFYIYQGEAPARLTILAVFLCREGKKEGLGRLVFEGLKDHTSREGRSASWRSYTYKSLGPEDG